MTTPTDSTPAPPPPKPPTEPKWSLWIMLLFAAVLLGGMMLDAPILAKLTDPAAARGLITFTISVATIGLAFTLVYHAFYAAESSDDRFRRGREVFTGLMGILGTIVGFYFGSTESPSSKLEIAEIKVEGQFIRTHVVGGTPPIKFSITSDQSKFIPFKNQLSDDGWISVQTIEPVTQGTLTVDVTDSKDRKATRDKKVEGQSTNSANSQASPSNPSPTPAVPQTDGQPPEPTQ